MINIVGDVFHLTIVDRFVSPNWHPTPLDIFLRKHKHILHLTSICVITKAGQKEVTMSNVV